MRGLFRLWHGYGQRLAGIQQLYVIILGGSVAGRGIS